MWKNPKYFFQVSVRAELQGTVALGRGVFRYRSAAGGMSSFSSGQAKAACTPPLIEFLSMRETDVWGARAGFLPRFGQSTSTYTLQGRHVPLQNCVHICTLITYWKKRRRKKEGKITKRSKKVSNLQFRQRCWSIRFRGLRNTEGVKGI